MAFQITSKATAGLLLSHYNLCVAAEPGPDSYVLIHLCAQFWGDEMKVTR
jgi:hypothetical protein